MGESCWARTWNTLRELLSQAVGKLLEGRGESLKKSGIGNRTQICCSNGEFESASRFPYLYLIPNWGANLRWVQKHTKFADFRGINCGCGGQMRMPFPYDDGKIFSFWTPSYPFVWNPIYKEKKGIISKRYSSQAFRDIDPKPLRGDQSWSNLTAPGTRCQVWPVARCDQASIVPWSLNVLQ